MKTKKEKIYHYLSLSGAVTAMLATLIAGVLSFSTGHIISQKDLNAASSYLSSDFEVVNVKLERLKQQLEIVQELPKDISVATSIELIQKDVEYLNNKFKSIEKVILNSPEKALEIPMLKRDIESLQKQQNLSIQSLGREISRAYDTMKWVIGTILLGIVGLAISVFLREKQKS